MLLAARPSLEPLAIGSAVLNEILGFGIAERVAPHACKADARLCNEVLEIALPTAAEVRKEQEPVGAGQQHPSREMDGADVTEITRAIERGQLCDAPEREPQHQAPHPAGLHDGD